MSLLDVAIVIAFAFSGYNGYRRGFVRPVLSQVAVLGSLALVFTQGATLGGESVPAIVRLGGGFALVSVLGIVGGAVASRVAPFVERVPGVKRVDPYFGVAFSALLTFLTVYVVLLGASVVDEVLSPVHAVTAIGPAQVAGLRARLQSSPAAALVFDAAGLERLQRDARVAPVPIERLGEYAPIAGLYEQQLRRTLTGSALLSPMLRLGARVPLVGREVHVPQPIARDQPPS